MRIEEFDDYMNRNMQSIPDAVILPSVQELVNLVRNRVISKGLSAEGGSFSSYSAAYLSKSRKTKTHKNFYDTGKMWESFGVKDREDQPGLTIVKCRMDESSRDEGTNQTLMEKHSRIEGIDIIAATDEEEKKMADLANKRLEALWA